MQPQNKSLPERIIEQFQSLNVKRNPRTNTLVIAALILLGGFMTYNYVGSQLTYVESISKRPAVATPKPSISVTPTPDQSDATVPFGFD